ncbi:MAG: hypothetical protein ABIQ18_25955 [Umezawaea sp.]
MELRVSASNFLDHATFLRIVEQQLQTRYGGVNGSAIAVLLLARGQTVRPSESGRTAVEGGEVHRRSIPRPDPVPDARAGSFAATLPGRSAQRLDRSRDLVPRQQVCRVLVEACQTGSSADHAANPTSLHDVLIRAGGTGTLGRASITLRVNSDDELLNDEAISLGPCRRSTAEPGLDLFGRLGGSGARWIVADLGGAEPSQVLLYGVPAEAEALDLAVEPGKFGGEQCDQVVVSVVCLVPVHRVQLFVAEQRQDQSGRQP